MAVTTEHVDVSLSLSSSAVMAATPLVKALYRALLETTRSLEGSPLRLRLPVSQAAVQWMGREKPQFSFVPATSASRALFPSSRNFELPAEADSPVLEPEAVRRIIRGGFRQPLAPGADGADLGLYALKVLHGQLAMARRSSAVRSEGDGGAALLVEATSAYRGKDGGSHVFQYRLRLTNVGTVPVQVVGRGWEIRNADGSPHATVPRGSPGLVGQTPRLLPNGEAFEYASGTTLATPTGTIEGTLQVMTLTGEDGSGTDVGGRFDAVVGRFRCDAGETEQ